MEPCKAITGREGVWGSRIAPDAIAGGLEQRGGLLRHGGQVCEWRYHERPLQHPALSEAGSESRGALESLPVASWWRLTRNTWKAELHEAPGSHGGGPVAGLPELRGGVPRLLNLRSLQDRSRLWRCEAAADTGGRGPPAGPSCSVGCAGEPCSGHRSRVQVSPLGSSLAGEQLCGFFRGGLSQHKRWPAKAVAPAFPELRRASSASAPPGVLRPMRAQEDGPSKQPRLLQRAP
mmetsp:Transcript_46968/g.109808  ORF Transcript_46968/g.109808 Transcript_46968/m.109808 type:complete len:234 (+) Transcript_46968:275-976(+)